MNNMRVSTNGGLVRENWFDLNASRYTASSTLQRMELLEDGLHGYTESGLGQPPVPRTDRTTRAFLHTERQSFFYPSANLSFLFSNAFAAGMVESWQIPAFYGIVGNAPETYAANIIYEQGSDRLHMELCLLRGGNANIRPEKSTNTKSVLKASSSITAWALTHCQLQQIG